MVLKTLSSSWKLFCIKEYGAIRGKRIRTLYKQNCMISSSDNNHKS